MSGRGNFLHDAGSDHLALEVAAVETGAEQDFVEALQVGHREFVVQEFEADGLEVEVPAKALHRRLEDLFVVEGKRRKFVDGEPGSLGGIVAAYHAGRLDEGVPGQGDHTFARIAVQVGEDAQFADGGRLQRGFLAEFAQRALAGRLGIAQESARKGPQALAGFGAAPHQQDFQPPLLESEDDTVRGDRHMLVLVLVGVLRPRDIGVILGHNDTKIGHFRTKTNNFVSI